MNVQAAIPRRSPVKLTVPSFLILRQAGAFSSYERSELLDGELWGTPRAEDEREQSDASYPIKLPAEYYRALAEFGAFDQHGKTELIDGRVFALSPQYRSHGFVKDELAYRLRRYLEGAAIGSALGGVAVATEQSVALSAYHEPQPDIILTTQPRGTGPIPLPSVHLIVEISDATLAFDRNDKARLYASHGIAEYWVADVNGRTIHQLWSPAGGAYTETGTIAFGEPLTSATLPDLTIETSGLG